MAPDVRRGGSRTLAFKHAILGLLSERHLHGYEMRAVFERRLSGASKLNVGQVYATLERMERTGLVDHRVVTQDERPDKKVYRLTSGGRAELERWLSEPSVPDLDLRNETFLKLMIARRLKGSEAREVVRRERRACMDRLSEVEAARSTARREGDDVGTLLQLDLAALRLDAFIRWLDGCERVLEEEET